MSKDYIKLGYVENPTRLSSATGKLNVVLKFENN